MTVRAVPNWSNSSHCSCRCHEQVEGRSWCFNSTRNPIGDLSLAIAARYKGRVSAFLNLLPNDKWISKRSVLDSQFNQSCTSAFPQLQTSEHDLDCVLVVGLRESICVNEGYGYHVRAPKDSVESGRILLDWALHLESII